MCPPFALRQASIRFGMELLSLSHISGVILSQILCIASFNWSMLLGSNFCSWWSTHDQRFSIGFRSGHLADHGSIIIFSAEKYSLMKSAVWHGALSCWKYNTNLCWIGKKQIDWWFQSFVQNVFISILVESAIANHVHIEVCQADTCHFSSSKHETDSFC